MFNMNIYITNDIILQKFPNNLFLAAFKPLKEGYCMKYIYIARSKFAWCYEILKFQFRVDDEYEIALHIN